MQQITLELSALCASRSGLARQIDMQFRCLNCQQPIAVEEAELQEGEEISCPSCKSHFTLPGDDTVTYAPEANVKIGHFELRDLLGTGGFGDVYRAWDRDSNLTLPSSWPVPDAMRKPPARFCAKRAAAAIKHPNVVGVHELGKHEDSFYIVGELVEGLSLSDYLKQDLATPHAAAKLFVKMLDAAQVFHNQGVIHRDLKPSNVLIDRHGEPKIADFGLARRDAPNSPLKIPSHWCRFRQARVSAVVLV